MHKISCLITLIMLLASQSGAYAENNESGETSGSVDALKDIPDPFDCQIVSWLSGCSELNEIAKKNPSAPLRIRSKTGLEFNFPPGTPSKVISHILKPSPQTAKALADEIEAHGMVANLAAKYWNEEIKRRGGILPNGFVSPHNNTNPFMSPALNAYQQETSRNLTIKYNNIKVYVFIRKNCRSCKNYLSKLSKLSKNHPDLHIRILHLDGSKKAAENLQKQYGLPVSVVAKAKRQSYEARMAGADISTWIQDSRTQQSNQINHAVDIHRLKAAIAEVSQ